MHLIVDDRERQVIPAIKALHDIEVKRITVGDYVYTHGGKIICIVERKSLADLASSIKDGRMDNHNKLLNAQKLCKCMILYIIEGPAYPSLNKSFARMDFKCLQGKLDSIMFRSDIKIIWTRDVMHTAERLVGLCHTFARLIDQGVFSHLYDNTDNNTNNKQDAASIVDSVETTGATETVKPVKTNEIKTTDNTHVYDIVNAKHEVKLDIVHIQMLSSINGISYKAAMSMLLLFNIRQLLFCEGVTAQDWYNAKHPDSLYKLGNRGIKMFGLCQRLHNDAYAKILSQISGITRQTAESILKSVNAVDIINCKFKENTIANIKKESGKRVGKTIEDRIKLTFNVK